MNAQSTGARAPGAGYRGLLAGGAGIVLAVCSGAAAADDVLVQELLKKLEERDAVIADLVDRVHRLERRLGADAAAAPAAPAAPAGAGAASAPPPQAAPGASPQTPAAADTGTPAAPGAFAVDPKAAERALERTLVQTGALLLPAGAVDVEPALAYFRRQTTAPFLSEVDDVSEVVTRDIRENDLIGALGLRFGLPWTSQFEIELPFVYKDDSQVFANTKESASAFGFGDVSVGLAKELVRERGWRPDLLARVTWDADTGQEKDGLALGSGFHGLTGSLTALKRQDPLAFVASGFYRTRFAQNDVAPGDEFGFTVGAVLAASPETSLSVSLQQTFSKELTVGGRALPGSDQVSGILGIGASSVLGRGVLLSVDAGVGLTDDAPDYFIGVSLPIRFNLPVR